METSLEPSICGVSPEWAGFAVARTSEECARSSSETRLHSGALGHLMCRAQSALLTMLLAAAMPGCAGVHAMTGVGLRSGARIVDAPWAWIDEDGVGTTFARWRGSMVVATGFFGSCTTRCPRTIDKLREMDGTLRSHGQSAQFVLVTIDPDNDSVERLRRLKQTRHLPSSWHLLRGSREDTRGFAQFIGLNVARDSGHIDHDVRVAMFAGGGAILHTFTDWSFGEEDILAVSR